MVVHYETELTAETEDEVYENIIQGNTIVEEASITAAYISSDADIKALITQTRQSDRSLSGSEYYS